jgi:hypothetical protein
VDVLHWARTICRIGVHSRSVTAYTILNFNFNTADTVTFPQTSQCFPSVTYYWITCFVRKRSSSDSQVVQFLLYIFDAYNSCMHCAFNFVRDKWAGDYKIINKIKLKHQRLTYWLEVLLTPHTFHRTYTPTNKGRQTASIPTNIVWWPAFPHFYS